MPEYLYSPNSGVHALLPDSSITLLSDMITSYNNGRLWQSVIVLTEATTLLFRWLVAIVTATDTASSSETTFCTCTMKHTDNDKIRIAIFLILIISLFHELTSSVLRRNSL